MVIKYTARRNCTVTRRGCNGNWEEKHFVIERYRSFFVDNRKRLTDVQNLSIADRTQKGRQADRQTGVLARWPYHKFLTLTNRYSRDS